MTPRHRHFSKEDGGFYISGKLLGLILTISGLLGAFAAVIVSAQTLKTDVSQLQKEHITFVDRQNTIEKTISSHEVEDATMKEQLVTLQRDVSEIKSDVKALRKS